MKKDYTLEICITLVVVLGLARIIGGIYAYKEVERIDAPVSDVFINYIEKDTCSIQGWCSVRYTDGTYGISRNPIIGRNKIVREGM